MSFSTRGLHSSDSTTKWTEPGECGGTEVRPHLPRTDSFALLGFIPILNTTATASRHCQNPDHPVSPSSAPENADAAAECRMGVDDLQLTGLIDRGWSKLMPRRWPPWVMTVLVSIAHS